MLKSTIIAATLTLASLGAAEAGCKLQSVSGANASLPTKRVNVSLLNAAILSEVNYVRCKHGRAPLKAAKGMTKQADAHSKWMARAQRLTHKGRSTLTGRLKGSGVRFRTGAENIGVFHVYRIDGVMTRDIDIRSCRIAYMDGSTVPRHSYASLAKMAVNYFMDSPKHRKNLLHRGVGLVGNGSGIDLKAKRCGKIYMTQIFAG
ncbi:CAP domain-containing protein [Aliiroseovarius sp. KMU-50]|uniref:CAP domain-containing protein n=1 Tax=Aliiroseovarius salicola TaxID=3009082 RepID=A0ABT4W5W1_9RHOB|nr:CAP domain-containing protein [Aliiroseovarius sp. KMU-50]MDA5095380.1 CAP domain-containing protein [Aliiroseovarius sp. KMU-50]